MEENIIRVIRSEKKGRLGNIGRGGDKEGKEEGKVMYTFRLENFTGSF